MIEYVFKMFFCLLAAAAIGFLVSWFLRRLRILELEDDVFSAKRALTDRESKVSAAAKRVEEFQSTLSSTQQTLAVATSDLESTGKKYQDARDHSARLSADVTTKDASIASLTAIVAMRESSLKTRDAKLIEIEGVATRRSQEIDTLRGQLARAQATVEANGSGKDSEIARLKGTLSQREAEIKTRDSDIVRLTAQLAPLVSLPTMIGRKDDELLKSNRLLADSQGQIDQLRIDLGNAKPRADQSSADLRAKTEAFTQLTREYEAVSKTLASRTQSLTDTQEQLRKAQAASHPGEAKGTSATTVPRASAVTYARQLPNPPAQKDDIKHIYGVGPALEITLNKLGVYYFKQVALWSEADIDFFDSKLPEFHGRIRRENWIRSAIEEHYKKHGEWLANGNPLLTMPETNRS